MPEAVASIQETVTAKAVEVAGAAARELVTEARKDPATAWRWSVIGIMGLGLLFLIYLLVKDARDGHAMTKEEYESVTKVAADALKKDNDDRDQRLAAVRASFNEMTLKLTSALDGVAKLAETQRDMVRDAKDSEGRLRTEIQSVSGRVDRVLERLPPK